MVLQFLKDAIDFIGEVLTAPERQERQRYERERQYYMDKFKIAHRRCGGTAYPVPGPGVEVTPLWVTVFFNSPLMYKNCLVRKGPSV